MVDFILSRSWVEVAEAAKYISQKSNQKVKSSDIFDMAVQGKLKIHAYFSKKKILVPCDLDGRQFYLGIDPLKVESNPFSLGFFYTNEPKDKNGRQRLKTSRGVVYLGKSIIIKNPNIDIKNGVTTTSSSVSYAHGLHPILPIAGFRKLLRELAYGEDSDDESKEIENFFYLELGSSIYVLAESDKKEKVRDCEPRPIVNLLEHAKLVLKPNDIIELLNSINIQQDVLNTSKEEIIQSSTPAEPITTLQAIGIMAELLAEAESGQRFRKGESNVNAAAIGTAVAARAKIRFGNNIRGFETFNKKIGEGLKALEKIEKN